jgi:hypothetical protein
MGNVSRGFEYGYDAYFGNIAAALSISLWDFLKSLAKPEPMS